MRVLRTKKCVKVDAKEFDTGLGALVISTESGDQIVVATVGIAVLDVTSVRLPEIGDGSVAAPRLSALVFCDLHVVNVGSRAAYANTHTVITSVSIPQRTSRRFCRIHPESALSRADG
jgi:hypothetical protein